MPTLAGLRRRGVTPEAIRAFCERIGVSTRDSVVDVTLLEHALREDLNARSPRVMAVLRPLEVVIENFPEGEVDEFDAPFDPDKPEARRARSRCTREAVHRARRLRRGPAQEVAPPRARRRGAPPLRVPHHVQRRRKDDAGTSLELRCTWDPASKGGAPPTVAR